MHPGPVATPMVLNEAMYRRLRPDLDNPTAADAAEVTMIDVNLTGVWHTCRAGAPHLVARGAGAIVLTNSIAGLRGWPGSPITPPPSTVLSD